MSTSVISIIFSNDLVVFEIYFANPDGSGIGCVKPELTISFILSTVVVVLIPAGDSNFERMLSVMSINYNI